MGSQATHHNCQPHIKKWEFSQGLLGCGKTHISNTIAAVIHTDGNVAHCVASSDIAALLLHHGWTAH